MARRASILRSQRSRSRPCRSERNRPVQLETSMNSEIATRNVVSVNDPAPLIRFARHGTFQIPTTMTLDAVGPQHGTGRSATDENAKPWGAGDASDRRGTLEGEWSSRWNGAADPTIPGDAPDKWKPGQGEAENRGRPRVPVVRLGFRQAQGTDRRQARRSAPAGGQSTST